MRLKEWPASPSQGTDGDRIEQDDHRTGRDRSERVIPHVPRRHLYRRLRHRRDRDEL
jgi:hypothetical protein